MLQTVRVTEIVAATAGILGFSSNCKVSNMLLTLSELYRVMLFAHGATDANRAWRRGAAPQGRSEKESIHISELKDPQINVFYLF